LRRIGYTVPGGTVSTVLRRDANTAPRQHVLDSSHASAATTIGMSDPFKVAFKKLRQDLVLERNVIRLGDEPGGPFYFRSLRPLVLSGSGGRVLGLGSDLLRLLILVRVLG
jgi:hypothetical protein